MKMNSKSATGIALLIAATVLLGAYAFAEEALPAHEDVNAAIGGHGSDASIGADDGGIAAEETAGSDDAAAEAENAAAKAVRERARIAAEEAKQKRENSGNGKEAGGTGAEAVPEEPANYETILAQIGEGLGTEGARNLGEIMSEIAHRQAKARQDMNLTGKERAEFNRQLNAYLKDMRADLRLAVKDKNLSQVVARELVRRADAAAKAKNPAELSPEQVVDELAVVVGVTDPATQAQLKDLLREQLKNRIHFLNRFIERLRTDAKFRQHFKDWVHRQVAKAKIVQPEAVLENPAARAIDHNFVREHLLEKLRQRLRDRAHNAKQASIVPEIVQDMVDENAIINPAVVQAGAEAEINPAEIQVDDSVLSAEVNPAVVQPQ